MGYKKVEVVKVYGPECFYCGITGDTTVDHVIPRCNGGTNDLGNKVPCCHKCNNLKGNLSLEAFIDKHAERIKPFFKYAEEFRQRMIARKVTVICKCCQCEFIYIQGFLSNYCSSECSKRAQKCRNQVLRETPIYGRLVLETGIDFPPSIYK